MRNKHKRFAQEYIIDYNAAAAAHRVGYSFDTANQTGYRLINLPNVIAYIKELQLKATERAEISEDFIIQTLLKVIDKGLGVDTSDVIVKESIGTGMSQTSSMKLSKVDLAAVKGAAELLGRYKGMFTDKVDLKHSGQILKRVINVNPTKKDK